MRVRYCCFVYLRMRTYCVMLRVLYICIRICTGLIGLAWTFTFDVHLALPLLEGTRAYIHIYIYIYIYYVLECTMQCVDYVRVQDAWRLPKPNPEKYDKE